jgi:hypothetical protein
MIQTTIDLSEPNIDKLNFEIEVGSPSAALVSMWDGVNPEAYFNLRLNRDDVCRLFVALRGWLYATDKKATKAGINHDKEIIN